MKTIEQVLSIFPETTKENWHQHTNGKGWVYVTAYVDETAYIGEDALVYGKARVYDNAWVYGYARVFGNAWVSGNAWVYGYAWVSGNAWALSPLYIQGSRHAVNLVTYSTIAIGCRIWSIQYWKDNYKEIGEQERYSTQQIEEYLSYILLCEQYVARYAKK